jgi:hypothetical protein
MLTRRTTQRELARIDGVFTDIVDTCTTVEGDADTVRVNET